ncbi:hypothetical protein [Limosilactobacillus caviae]|jgi:hypothetical protein|uniref:Uncharacterized protein n=1 Tax=Limosilactobacillus caviae TaxID=1769424 RepID=A0ABQ2C8A0_9LACO|nr:hypothetical protein [Limosilactobacillus caviae]MRH47331.1 hypothetical protein [Limosilactobacillus reuteri]GGI64320.1 hypothetical protein GCM10011459_21540 [Limosilactobacillus caviae]
MELKKALTLENFAQTVYRKCDCCKRVRDIYFRLNIRDAKTASMLVGSLELCKECGYNMGDITKTQIQTERTLEEFSFE